LAARCGGAPVAVAAAVPARTPAARGRSTAPRKAHVCQGGGSVPTGTDTGHRGLGLSGQPRPFQRSRPLSPRAAAAVPDIGSVIAHAALVAREYGIPAVVGAGNATSTLRDGELVIMDGTRGVVERV